jgi:phage terminase Nu1 subunit (DNA packaging protein)
MPYMSLMSISSINELTGVDRRTIKRRLEDLKPIKEGRAFLYESREALPLLFLSKDEYDLSKERARLAFWQANKTELESEVLKGELIPADQVWQQWERMVSNFRAKMLSLPTKTGHLLLNIADFEEIEAILKNHVYEALKELSHESTEKVNSSGS